MRDPQIPRAVSLLLFGLFVTGRIRSKVSPRRMSISARSASSTPSLSSLPCRIVPLLAIRLDRSPRLRIPSSFEITRRTCRDDGVHSCERILVCPRIARKILRNQFFRPHPTHSSATLLRNNVEAGIEAIFDLHDRCVSQCDCRNPRKPNLYDTKSSFYANKINWIERGFANYIARKEHHYKKDFVGKHVQVNFLQNSLYAYM